MSSERVSGSVAGSAGSAGSAVSEKHEKARLSLLALLKVASSAGDSDLEELSHILMDQYEDSAEAGATYGYVRGLTDAAKLVQRALEVEVLGGRVPSDAGARLAAGLSSALEGHAAAVSADAEKQRADRESARSGV